MVSPSGSVVSLASCSFACGSVFMRTPSDRVVSTDRTAVLFARTWCGIVQSARAVPQRSTNVSEYRLQPHTVNSKDAQAGGCEWQTYKTRGWSVWKTVGGRWRMENPTFVDGPLSPRITRR